MLIDDVDITLRAGHGGPGKVSFNGYGPDGGNGGRGGDIFLCVTSDLRALNQFSSKKAFMAANGEPGLNRRSYGKKGEDITLSLPIGSALTEKDSGETIELNDLTQKILICQGGLGGKGNLEFKSGKNRSPKYAQPGLPGEFKKFKVNLKFIADFGLVGLPNAGKSSLLNELTNANATVAAYPFTTLEAGLGVINNKIIADIPGLIEGASSGRGLGIKFLKHIEKVKMILHCIAADSADIISDFETVNKELENYKKELTGKKRIIVLTKTDLVDRNILKQLVIKLKIKKNKVLPISIYDFDSIERLKKELL